MTSFAEFNKNVEAEERSQTSNASSESQRLSTLKMSIKTEIDMLHKMKEVRDELQIMQQVSILQEDINSSFQAILNEEI
jgi:hypothetical protein